MRLETDIQRIQQLAQQRAEVNWAFRCFLKGSDLSIRNIDFTVHDLRRYSATYACCSGVPLEISAKVILRHQDLKTTQTYLGRVTESEAIRWMDLLHGR
jgi:integrase